MTKQKEHDINHITLTPEEEERAKRINCEFANARDLLKSKGVHNTIVMFGSARINPASPDCNELARPYYEAARELANRLALWSKSECKKNPNEDKYYIVSGGGGGIMEAANRGAKEAGEPTIGLNILLPFEQKVNPYVSDDLAISFHYFFIRKFYFAYFAKAIAVFPGGFGTMDELFEILTLAQTGKMQNNVPVVIFGKEFFSKFLNIDFLLEHGFIGKEDQDLFLLTDDVNEAFLHITKNIRASKKLVHI